jgi:hypothetical protein
MIEVKDAIKIAKDYVAEVFADEGVFNIGLEEIEHGGDVWEVTVGFSRKWDKPPRSPFAGITGLTADDDDRAIARTYKVVEVAADSGIVIQLRNRVGLT